MIPKDKRRTPKVHKACVGCGMCEMICPVEPAAIVIDERKKWGQKGHAVMKYFIDELRTMLGGNPKKWDKSEYSKDVRKIHAFKQTPEQRKLRIAAIREELANKVTSNRWRLQRWASIIIVNAIFVFSYWFDVQLVEGALTASRFVGFHLADLNSALQVVLAYKVILINLVIGTVTVILIWWFVGGRSFCSWVCPYHLLAEIAEMVHVKLVDNGIGQGPPHAPWHPYRHVGGVCRAGLCHRLHGI